MHEHVLIHHQHISKSYLVLNTTAQNSAIICQSTTSTYLLRIIQYTGSSYNSKTQSGNVLIVYGGTTGNSDTGR